MFNEESGFVLCTDGGMGAWDEAVRSGDSAASRRFENVVGEKKTVLQDKICWYPSHGPVV